MNLLIFTNKDPLFGKGGDHLRARSAVQILSSFASLTLLSPQYRVVIREDLMDDFPNKMRRLTVEPGEAFSGKKTAAPKLKGLRFAKDLIYEYFLRSARWVRQFEGELSRDNFQAVWLEGDYFFGHYIRYFQEKGLKVFYNTHNHQSFLNYETRRYNSKNDWRKILKNYINFRMAAAHERIFYKYSDRLFYCNEKDGAYYGRFVEKARLLMYPNVVPEPDHDAIPPPDLPSRRIVWVGSMIVGFHSQGLIFFLEKVWPGVRQRYPDLWFVIAGRAVGEAPSLMKLAAEADNIRVYKNPETVTGILRGSQLMVVPLFIGSGTRIKILEAANEGIPVVSTTLGAEGLGMTDGRDICIADSPEAFIEKISRLLNTSGARSQLIENARRRVRRDNTIAAVRPLIEETVRQVVHPMN